MSVARDRESVKAGRPMATGVGVLDRSVAVLTAVEAGARTFTEIVAATGLPRSTVHRLLRALCDHGLLAPAGDGYRLGPRLLSLAATAVRELPLRDLAHPHLVALARETGESAQLYVRDGDRRVCVDAVESSSELRTIVGIGAALPLERGSAGKVFLAWDTAGVDATGDGPTPVELARIRRQGWARSVGEREPGVASVSAPVLGPGDTCLAVVSVSGPGARFDPRAPGSASGRYADAVLTAARAIAGAAG